MYLYSKNLKSEHVEALTSLAQAARVAPKPTPEVLSELNRIGEGLRVQLYLGEYKAELRGLQLAFHQYLDDHREASCSAVDHDFCEVDLGSFAAFIDELIATSTSAAARSERLVRHDNLLQNFGVNSFGLSGEQMDVVEQKRLEERRRDLARSVDVRDALQHKQLLGGHFCGCA